MTAWALMLGWVVFCFTIFRCPNLSAVWALYTGVTRAGSHARLVVAWWPVLALLGIAHYSIWRSRDRLIAASRDLPDAIFYPAVGIAGAALIFFTPLNAAPFIYFQF